MQYVLIIADICESILKYQTEKKKKKHLINFSNIQPVIHTRTVKMLSKKQQLALFASAAVALYGYDQGMMNMINTNRNYLQTMGLAAKSPIVGFIVSVY